MDFPISPRKLMIKNVRVTGRKCGLRRIDMMCNCPISDQMLEVKCADTGWPMPRYFNLVLDGTVTGSVAHQPRRLLTERKQYRQQGGQEAGDRSGRERATSSQGTGQTNATTTLVLNTSVPR